MAAKDDAHVLDHSDGVVGGGEAAGAEKTFKGGRDEALTVTGIDVGLVRLAEKFNRPVPQRISTGEVTGEKERRREEGERRTGEEGGGNRGRTGGKTGGRQGGDRRETGGRQGVRWW
jgi:hypothetical protein